MSSRHKRCAESQLFLTYDEKNNSDVQNLDDQLRKRQLLNSAQVLNTVTHLLSFFTSLCIWIVFKQSRDHVDWLNLRVL